MIVLLLGLLCLSVGTLSLFSERFNKMMDKVRARNESNLDPLCQKKIGISSVDICQALVYRQLE
jgi:hypothetical protein